MVDLEVSLHANMCVPLMYTGRENEALEHAEQARTAAETLGQPTVRTLSLWAACMVQWQLGRHERVRMGAGDAGKAGTDAPSLICAFQRFARPNGLTLRASRP